MVQAGLWGKKGAGQWGQGTNNYFESDAELTRAMRADAAKKDGRTYDCAP